MSTGCRAEMKFTDVSALSDAKTVSNTAQDISNMSLFGQESMKKQRNYGTLELNQFVLDGSKTVCQDVIDDVAFWSTEKSDDNCLFKSNPKIVSVFSE